MALIIRVFRKLVTEGDFIHLGSCRFLNSEDASCVESSVCSLYDSH